MKEDISLSVIKRLPRYYRFLEMLKVNGIARISSKELAERMGLTASQIRHDFNCFGGFGQQGYGYNVEVLYKEIGDILGLNDGDTMIIVGAGNLGRALASHDTFEKRGFKLVGLFDSDEKIIGTEINGIKVQGADNLEKFVRSNRVDIAILTVPKAAVQPTAELLAAAGVKGLMNFAYTELDLPEDIAVSNVHLSDPLMYLSYRIKNK